MSDTRSTTGDLGRVISNAQARAIIYGTYIIVLTLAGAATAGFAVLQDGLPQWLTVTNAVLIYLSIPISGLALANTVSITKPAEQQVYEVSPAPTTESVNPENM